MCKDWRPTIILATGLAPLDQHILAKLRADETKTVNYLTDDPWNPVHRAAWFLRALPKYSAVFSPRRSNLTDLRNAGCAAAAFLPFAYDPAIHFVGSDSRASGLDCDVVFFGGADRDRVPYFQALVEAGVRLAIFGDYWRRHPRLLPAFRGYADLPTLRRATSNARICLCLVRRANRDGHTMRSFEAAAMGGCMLIEDTPEHHEIFGDEGAAVIFFRSIAEMVERTRWLLAHDAERRRLAAAAHARITQGRNTYADRLQTILQRLAFPDF